MQFRRVVHEAQSVLLVLALKYVVQHLYGIFAQENTPEEFVMRNLNMLIIAAVMQGAALVLGAIVFALASMSTPGAPQTSQLGSQFHALFARTAVILPGIGFALFIVTLEDCHRHLGEDTEVQDLLEIIFNGMVVLFSVNFLYALQSGPSSSPAPEGSASTPAAAFHPQRTLLLDASVAVGVGVRFFRAELVSEVWVLLVGLVNVAVVCALYFLSLNLIKWGRATRFALLSISALVKLATVALYILIVFVFLAEHGLFIEEQASVLTTRARLLDKLAPGNEKLPAQFQFLERYRGDVVWSVTFFAVLGIFAAGAVFSVASVALGELQTKPKNDSRKKGKAS